MSTTTGSNMPKDAYITARVDKRLKAKAEKVMRSVGVSTTELITMMLHQVVLHNGVPFEVRIPNKETRAAMAEIDAGGGETSTDTTTATFERIVKSRK
jgi:DNA-damage-inducible protein J